MRELSLENMKEIELRTLGEIDAICRENGFRYSLCGGTLLGAVRHKGFIPWDDDIDIFMPRKDYDAFVKYCVENETPFSLLCTETNKNYGYIYAKAIAKETVIVERAANRCNLELGVFVDVFPLDGMGHDLESAKKNFNKARFYRELLVAWNWKKFFRSKTRSIVYEPIRLAFFLLSRFARPDKLIEKIQSSARKIDFDTSVYAGNLGGTYRFRETMETAVQNQFVEMEFEGKSFFGIKDYHSYLTNLYGNYMQMPPEEKRVTHHNFDAYYKD